MKYKILIQDEKIWEKDWQKISIILQNNIKSKIIRLGDIPWERDLNIKKLKKYPTADFRLRIGNYRVLFDKFDEEKVIKLYRILHRSKLY